jgi:hypothetical protein
MDFISIKPTRSPDSEGFMRGLDPTGLDPADLKPDPPEPLDIFDVARKAQLATAPRTAIDLGFLKVPSMDDEVDDDGDPIPMMFKLTAIDPPSPASAVSDWKADFLKRALSEPANTLKKKLRITSTTIREDADGVKWLGGFDASGTMVDCRTLLE